MKRALDSSDRAFSVGLGEKREREKKGKKRERIMSAKKAILTENTI